MALVHTNCWRCDSDQADRLKCMYSNTLVRNLSRRILSDNEKKVLTLSLNFAIAPRRTVIQEIFVVKIFLWLAQTTKIYRTKYI